MGNETLLNSIDPAKSATKMTFREALFSKRDASNGINLIQCANNLIKCDIGKFLISKWINGSREEKKYVDQHMFAMTGSEYRNIFLFFH